MTFQDHKKWNLDKSKGPLPLIPAEILQTLELVSLSSAGPEHRRASMQKNASAVLAKSQAQSETTPIHWSDEVNASICDELLIIQGCLTLYCRQQINDCESILRTLPQIVAFHYQRTVLFYSHTSDPYLLKDIAFRDYKQCTICCGFLKIIHCWPWLSSSVG